MEVYTARFSNFFNRVRLHGTHCFANKRNRENHYQRRVEHQPETVDEWTNAIDKTSHTSLNNITKSKAKKKKLIKSRFFSSHLQYLVAGTNGETAIEVRFWNFNIIISQKVRKKYTIFRSIVARKCVWKSSVK